MFELKLIQLNQSGRLDAMLPIKPSQIDHAAEDLRRYPVEMDISQESQVESATDTADAERITKTYSDLDSTLIPLWHPRNAAEEYHRSWADAVRADNRPIDFTVVQVDIVG